MNYRWLRITALLLLPAACANEPPYDPLQDYVQHDPTPILDAPRVDPDIIAPQHRAVVAHGEYLVELLGCGACHTDGALVGTPNSARSLAGSRTGIAYTSPLQHAFPGVVYPPNITSDLETGIGRWSDAQIADAIRAGKGRHGRRRNLVMPWRGYALISDDDVNAIVHYLRSIDPVNHRVPDDVVPGSRALEPFVHFGTYERR